MPAVEGQREKLEIGEDLDLEMVDHPLPQPAQTIAPRPADEGPRHIDAQQPEHDQKQLAHRLRRRRPRGEHVLQYSTFYRAMLDEYRRDHAVDEILVEQRGQEADAGEYNGQREADQGDSLVGPHIGEEPPEGLGLADAVGADRGTRAEAPAAGRAVLGHLRR